MVTQLLSVQMKQECFHLFWFQSFHFIVSYCHEGRFWLFSILIVKCILRHCGMTPQVVPARSGTQVAEMKLCNHLGF